MNKVFFLVLTFFISNFSFSYPGEKNLIPKVCSKYLNSPQKICGAGSTFYVKFPNKKYQCNNGKCDYLVLTAAHLINGSLGTICLEKRCYPINLKDTLSDGKNDLAVIYIQVLKNERFDPTFAVIRDFKDAIIMPALNSVPLGIISKDSTLNGFHQVTNLSGDLIFSKATVVGSSNDSELNIKENNSFTNPPYIPLNIDLNIYNKDALGTSNKDLAFLDPLKTLYFSNRIVTTAHLGPGSSGSPLIYPQLTSNLYSHFAGVVNAHNYRISKSIISNKKAATNLIESFLSGKRGFLRNYDGKAFIFKYDHVTGDTYRVLEDGSISENITKESLVTFKDSKNSGGGDGGNSGGGDGGNSGGGDGGNSGGGNGGNSGDDDNKKKVDFESTLPGLIYKNEHTLAFELTKNSQSFIVYANTEALFAIEKLRSNHKYSINPILFSPQLNFMKLFEKKIKSEIEGKDFCKHDHCFSIKKIENDSIQLNYQNQIFSEFDANIMIYKDGSIQLETSLGEYKYITSFQPWINISLPTGFLSIDIRNIFMTDLSNVFNDNNSVREINKFLKKEMKPFLIFYTSKLKSIKAKGVTRLNLF